LNQGHDERRAAMNSLGRLPSASRLAVDHQHPIARTPLKLLYQQHHEREQKDPYQYASDNQVLKGGHDAQ
jgi:hypothetical protein